MTRGGAWCLVVAAGALWALIGCTVTIVVGLTRSVELPPRGAAPASAPGH